RPTGQGIRHQQADGLQDFEGSTGSNGCVGCMGLVAMASWALAWLLGECEPVNATTLSSASAVVTGTKLKASPVRALAASLSAWCPPPGPARRALRKVGPKDPNAPRLSTAMSVTQLQARVSHVTLFSPKGYGNLGKACGFRQSTRWGARGLSLPVEI